MPTTTPGGQMQYREPVVHNSDIIPIQIARKEHPNNYFSWELDIYIRVTGS